MAEEDTKKESEAGEAEVEKTDEADSDKESEDKKE